MEAVLTAKYAP